MLRATGLSKGFGTETAVDSLDLRLEKGEVVGLLGPNGAGKTTAMRMLSGVLSPDSGSVESERSLKQDVAIVLQETDYGSKLKAREFLGMMAVLNDNAVPVEKVVADTGLEGDEETFVKDLSGGTKKKLNIAAGLLKDPLYLLLDEPTAGLDPKAKKKVRDAVEGLSEDRGVLISTHIMEEAEKLCDRVLVIDQGEIVAEGETRELIDSIGAEYVIEARGRAPEVYREEAVTVDEFFELRTDRPHEVLEYLVDSGKMDDIEDLSVKRPGLEDVFLEVTGRRYHEEDS